MDKIKEILNDVWTLMLSLGRTISPWDIVDVLIIAYLIYRILTLMRKTSASSVIKGIIFLLVIAWVSNFLNMKVITYLLNQMLQMGLLVLIVLFQPELRKLFEQVGSSRLNIIFRKRIRLENAEAILRSVISASLAMADNRTGAIIVFEREVGLNDYAVTGTRLDATISSELIQSVFYKDSPLHDGALLVRDGRVLAASCMLPMTNNFNLSRDLGMRHRAGLGISERSDAVAVIVSEQTGTISVAVDGMLKRSLDPDIFEKLLIGEFMPGGRSKRAKKMKVGT
ncbi:MAG: diadenylate cyclase CdaA [Oscillospiraceae bacterium]|nr:diadenylate cyclase CdaA [Oscillospiraceae bacterium]